MVPIAVITVFCILFIGGECLGAEEMKIISEVHEQCIPTSGITEDMINDAKKGIFSEDPRFKEHVLCILKKMSIMTDDGKPDMDVIGDMVKTYMSDETAATQMVEKCTSIKATPQDTAYDMVKCVFEIKPLF